MRCPHSGFHGTWDNSPHIFDNGYFQRIALKGQMECAVTRRTGDFGVQPPRPRVQLPLLRFYSWSATTFYSKVTAALVKEMDQGPLTVYTNYKCVRLPLLLRSHGDLHST